MTLRKTVRIELVFVKNFNMLVIFFEIFFFFNNSFGEFMIS